MHGSPKVGLTGQGSAVQLGQGQVQKTPQNKEKTRKLEEVGKAVSLHGSPEAEKAAGSPAPELSFLLWADPSLRAAWLGGGPQAFRGARAWVPPLKGAFPKMPARLGASPQRSSFAPRSPSPRLLKGVTPPALPHLTLRWGLGHLLPEQSKHGAHFDPRPFARRE